MPAAVVGLPEEFVQGLYSWFPQAQARQILEGLRHTRPCTFRVNTLKADPAAVARELEAAGLRLERVPWYPLAFVVKNARESRLEELSAYQEGRIYLQSLSSMLPPLLLHPRPGESVLDVAAAPGSKTCQMAAMMANDGYILANDASPLRAERLRFNLARQGVRIARVSVQDGRTLGARLGPVFHRVLLDAPCSGEGRFVAARPATFRHWSARLVRRMAALQRRLLWSALRCLRVGGTLVYSTCTLNPHENEAVVDWALRKAAGAVQAVAAPSPVPGAWPALQRLQETAFHPEVRRAWRVAPSDRMEGFFLCALQLVRPLPAAQEPAG